MDEKAYDDFIKSLEGAKQKYMEWVATAKENDVTSLNKEMSSIEAPKLKGFFHAGDEWNFDYAVYPTYHFQIFQTESGTVLHLLWLRSGKMNASGNDYRDTDGFALLFNSVEEIDSFIDSISKDKIDSFEDKKDLFKD